MNMLDLSVIILTYNEELHIRRCIENVKPVAKEIFIVDSFSTDQTLRIAGELNARVYQNRWENDHAKQFNWALAHLPIRTKWVLRLDADEYLTDELMSELNRKLPHLPEEVTGIVFKRRHFFLGKWVRKGVYPVRLLRLFQYRKAFCEQRLMDEHIRITAGECIDFEADFIDHNLNDLSWWTSKHIGYAIREAAELLDVEFCLFPQKQKNEEQLSTQAAAKRAKKMAYARQPLFVRAFAYFVYRYIFKLGFTEGKEGFLWNFLQGWWYRTLVDVKIYEIKKACGNDREKIIAYLEASYHIDCRNI